MEFTFNEVTFGFAPSLKANATVGVYLVIFRNFQSSYFKNTSKELLLFYTLDKKDSRKNSADFQDHLNQLFFISFMATSQPAITCSKLTIETLEPDVKYVQS